MTVVTVVTVVRVATVVAEMALRRLVTKVTEITKKMQSKKLKQYLWWTSFCDEKRVVLEKTFVSKGFLRRKIWWWKMTMKLNFIKEKCWEKLFLIK